MRSLYDLIVEYEVYTTLPPTKWNLRLANRWSKSAKLEKVRVTQLNWEGQQAPKVVRLASACWRRTARWDEADRACTVDAAKSEADVPEYQLWAQRPTTPTPNILYQSGEPGTDASIGAAGADVAWEAACSSAETGTTVGWGGSVAACFGSRRKMFRRASTRNS